MTGLTNRDVKNLYILNTNTRADFSNTEEQKTGHPAEPSCAAQPLSAATKEIRTRAHAHTRSLRRVLALGTFLGPPSASSDLQELQNDLAATPTKEQKVPGCTGSPEQGAHQLRGAQSSAAARGEDRKHLLHMAGSFCPSVQNETPQNPTACRMKQGQLLGLGHRMNPPVTAAPAPLDRDAQIRQQKQARVWGWRCYL